MQFLWPGFLALLLIVPAMIGIYVWTLRRRRPSGVRYSSLSLVRTAQPGSSRLRRHLPFALFVVGLASLAVALSRPVTIVSVPAGQTTIILAIDVSGSMCSTDIQPTRLQAAEDAASSFIQRQGSTTQIGIVAFAGFAELVQSPTNDQELLLDAVRSLATGRRTAIGSGMLASIDAIAGIDPTVARSQTDPPTGPDPSPVPKGAYAPDIVVLLTDGANNAGPAPIDAAKQAADRGVRVYTIGFGSADGGAIDPVCGPQFVGREPGAFGGGFGGGGAGGGPGFRRGIDEATLKQVADMTGATYYPAESAGDLQNVFSNLPTSLITKHEVMEVSVAFVAVGFLLAMLGVFLAQLWRPLP
ncbi:MAG: VWA domain-containing protein [Chloroflexi bacterium]|nr:MAG: VWA domain-containing protein [Chloroflexota bacterium]